MEIAALAVEKDIYVISDEIYECLVYDGAVHTSIASFGPEIKDLTVVVNGLSNAYAMTRVGKAYAAGISEGFAGHYRNIGFFKQQ